MDAGIWMVVLCYEWGSLIEPSSMPKHRPPPDHWPLAVLSWCPQPLIYQHRTGTWLPSTATTQLRADIEARLNGGALIPTTIANLEADDSRAAYEARVARTVEYIRAGDIFQANIAQRFSATWHGSPRAIAQAAFHAAAPRYGAYVETAQHSLASMSPELFVHADCGGSIVTRPIKGTSPGSQDPALLLKSQKDAAELHMIVDLMRNDLGRLCQPGSVRVTSARQLESHATVHHGVAEVCGTMGQGIRLVDILRASFPPGSVTGAPKVRALQVIDELEPVSRGPYCGAVGAVYSGGVTLNVGIRTVCMHRDAPGARTGTLRYSAGCGIVADSVPVREYEESLHKTAVMIHTAHALRAGRG